MSEQPKTDPSQPSLASVEADLFRELFGFHEKTMTLLRQSSLNEEKLKVVVDRIKTLHDKVAIDLNRFLSCREMRHCETGGSLLS